MGNRFGALTTYLVLVIIIIAIVAILASALILEDSISGKGSLPQNQNSNNSFLKFVFPNELLASSDISEMNYSVVVAPLGNSAGSLNLQTMSPAGFTAVFSPSTVTLNKTGSNSTLSLGVSKSTEPGTYYLTLEAEGQGSNYSETIPVLVVRYLVVTINTTFVPFNLSVTQDSVVTWLRLNGVLSQQDNGAHDVDFSTGVSTVSPTLNQYQTWNYTFTQSGDYNYYCKYHPFMKGVVVVTQS